MLLDREHRSKKAVQHPAEWLARNDHDLELHQTIHRLIHPQGMAQPRIAEAVLLLEQYIAETAPVRVQVTGWGDGWAQAVAALSSCRSAAQIRAVQKLLRASNTKSGGE